jgi:hypothetical protein
MTERTAGEAEAALGWSLERRRRDPAASRAGTGTDPRKLWHLRQTVQLLQPDGASAQRFQTLVSTIRTGFCNGTMCVGRLSAVQCEL